MTTTAAAALALKDKADLRRGRSRRLFSGCDADAEARAKILSALGRVDALRLVRTQDELEAAFDLLATRRFFLEFSRFLSDEHVHELIRKERACEVTRPSSRTRGRPSSETISGSDLRVSSNCW